MSAIGARTFADVLTPAYQVKLLALACRDQAFLPGYSDVVEPRWFDSPIHADICRLAHVYNDKHGKGPTMDAVRQAVMAMLEADPKRAQSKDAYHDALASIEKASLEERADVTASAAEFARMQAVVQAIMVCAEDLDKRDTSKVLDRVQRALSTGQNKGDLGLAYFDKFERLQHRRQDEAVTTGLPSLDAPLDGGLCPGELGVVIGLPGGFKSGVLVNFGVGALKAGYSVVHLSMELSPVSLGRRYDGCLLGMTRQTGALADDIRREIQALAGSLKSRLFIRQWPIQTATPAIVRAHVANMVAARMVEPGRFVLIVDYGQIMAPGFRYNDKRHEHRETYQALRRMADEFRCPTWTAAQATRESESRTTLTMSSLSECFAIAADADVLLTISQTKEEKADGILRVGYPKVREGPGEMDVELVVDKALTRLSAPHGKRPRNTKERLRRQLRQQAIKANARLTEERQDEERDYVANLPPTRPAAKPVRKPARKPAPHA